jgi:tetratricopeptide (TPR) repeat protein
MQSTVIESKYSGPVPRNVQRHLILAYFTLGSYLMALPGKSADTMRESRNYIAIAVKLNEDAGSNFNFISQNSYIESFLGKLLLSMGMKSDAKEHLHHAVERFDRNWRAWWWLGRIYEIDRAYPQALEYFQKSAEGQASPALYGQLRSIVQGWMKNERIAANVDLTKYSKQAFDLDPEGNLNPKNISDYAYDLYCQGKRLRDAVVLEQAKQLLLKTYHKYVEVGNLRKANFCIWYAGECCALIKNQIDLEALEYYIESAALEGKQIAYRRLREKINCSKDYEKAIECFIRVIDRHPHEQDLYWALVDFCCEPIWNEKKQKLGADTIEKLDLCAKRHSSLQDAAEMLQRILDGNR